MTEPATKRHKTESYQWDLLPVDPWSPRNAVVAMWERRCLRQARVLNYAARHCFLFKIGARWCSVILASGNLVRLNVRKVVTGYGTAGYKAFQLSLYYGVSNPDWKYSTLNPLLECDHRADLWSGSYVCNNCPDANPELRSLDCRNNADDFQGEIDLEPVHALVCSHAIRSNPPPFLIKDVWSIVVTYLFVREEYMTSPVLE